MRRRSLASSHASGGFAGVNVTPMIDVIMCLIVFYLIVGKLAADQRVNLRLPLAGGGTPPAIERSLFINAQPVPPVTNTTEPARDSGIPGILLVVDRQTITLADVPTLIRTRRLEDPNAWITIRAERSLSFGQVSPLIRACREAGVTNIRLSAEPVGGS